LSLFLFLNFWLDFIRADGERGVTEFGKSTSDRFANRIWVRH